MAWAGEAESRRADLEALHQRIRALQREIVASEAVRDEAADSLSESERAISDSRRRLRAIAAARKDATADLAERSAERDRAAAVLDARRKALGDTLYRYYVFGRKAGARRIVGGDDPNQVARDAYYLERLAEARHAEIAAAREALSRHERLVAAVSDRQARVENLEREREVEHQQLLRDQQRRAEVLAKVQGRLKAQRREVATLERNEKRLTRLLDGLARIQPPRSPRKPPGQGEAAASGRGEPAAEAVTGRAEHVADDSLAGVAFAALRGRLKWPVRGELVGRFGAPRADGATVWKGVFIRAASGEVRAIAPGRVAFADWLRGFGNLIILDHGEGYMSVYGNNESLYPQAGAAVKAGEAIASVGASGGGEESGLYFEIRHKGQPLDPAKWVAGR